MVFTVNSIHNNSNFIRIYIPEIRVSYVGNSNELALKVHILVTSEVLGHGSTPTDRFILLVITVDVTITQLSWVVPPQQLEMFILIYN